MARAVSTVLDVAVCLLFVGAAVATLAGAPQPVDRDAGPNADTTASRVATVTTTVRATDDRREHATLAAHIGTAAVANASLGSERVAEGAYPSAVEDEVDASTTDRAFVTARWRPYPGAPLAGRIAAGEEPPQSADVAATTLTVDSGVSPPKPADSFETLAQALAAGYVNWLFPPERTYVRLVDDRTAASTASRYRTVADSLGTDVSDPVGARELRAANDDLSGALAARFEADLRTRYSSPEAAASNATVGEVELVVRRWEP